MPRAVASFSWQMSTGGSGILGPASLSGGEISCRKHILSAEFTSPVLRQNSTQCLMPLGLPQRSLGVSSELHRVQDVTTSNEPSG